MGLENGRGAIYARVHHDLQLIIERAENASGDGWVGVGGAHAVNEVLPALQKRPEGDPGDLAGLCGSQQFFQRCHHVSGDGIADELEGVGHVRPSFVLA